jgi:hypothetical protein
MAPKQWISIIIIESPNEFWILIVLHRFLLLLLLKKKKKIVKNSKMKRFQWKWIFTGSKTCCTIWRPFWFAVAAILNPKWPPKYKNPPIWAKFGFQGIYS